VLVCTTVIDVCPPTTESRYMASNSKSSSQGRVVSMVVKQQAGAGIEQAIY